MAATDGRLCPLGLLLAAFVCGDAARAEDHAGSAVVVYTDNNNVTVTAPVVTVSKSVGNATLDMKAGVDVISAASVDLVTAASPRGYRETRTHADTGATWDFGRGRSLTGGYSFSIESDTVSHALSLGGTHDFFDRLSSVSARLSFDVADIGRRGDDTSWKRRFTNEAELSWSQVLTRTIAADGIVWLSNINGFQASPYRYVRLYEPGEAAHLTALPEQVPDERLRDAVALRLRTELTRQLFLHGEYRLYSDSWGMLGHTATVRAALGLGPFWTVTAELRGHTQNGASFYRARYDTFPDAPQWRTAEKELGPMNTLLGGLRVEWCSRGDGHGVRIGAGADVLYLHYLDYLFLTSRTAVISGVDIDWSP